MRHRVVLGSAVFAALSFATFVSPVAAAESVEHGKEVFMTKGCWQCHGTVGQGGVGPRLAPEPMPFETLSAFIRTSSREMPPYRETVLSDADLADLYAYLKSVPPAKALKDIPLLAD